MTAPARAAAPLRPRPAHRTPPVTLLHRLVDLAVTALALWLLLGPALAAGEDERAQRERELARLRQQISELEQRLAAQADEKSALGAALRKAEVELARLAREIASLQSERTRREREIAALQQREGELEAKLVRHSAGLRRQVLAAHRVGRMQMLQLLLTQKDPALISRVMTYARYLNDARVKAITDTRTASRELAAVVAQSEAAAAALARAHESLLRERANLQRQREQRAQVLAGVDRELAQGSRELARLRQDSERLESLLRSLQALLADIPAAPLEQRPFRTLRGGLPWPARGEIRKRYDAPRGVGDLKWRGILIAAPEGNYIRAVHHGQVVFADWLPGFGLLAIVDHGEGYMSLYGYSRTLEKETGDWVTPGEVIATVGDSGGQKDSGLYFEIRSNGKPIDPLRWITRRYSTAAEG